MSSVLGLLSLLGLTAQTRPAEPRVTTSPHTTLFLHGLSGHASEFEPMMQWMRTYFGNSTPPMHSLALYEGLASLAPMVKQRDALLGYLMRNVVELKLAGGWNFVAHSQGALLARSVIQALPADFPPVLSYVSLAGPQKGQYGPCVHLAKWMNNSLVASVTRAGGWLTFYNPLAQDVVSVANYWNDPRHQRSFRATSDFLPLVNNLLPHANASRYKAAFLRLRRAVFLGSSGDDCISPPLSSVFEYLDPHDNPTATNASAEYVNDTFGLLTMARRGALFVASPPGQSHDAWRLEEALFREYVAPQLL